MGIAGRRRAGVVLAGGYSTRFGEREKALAKLDGRPLIAHAVKRVAPAVDGILVNCRREQTPGFRRAFPSISTDAAFVCDPEPDRGPAAGLATALEAVAAPLVAVVACDMPFVDAAFKTTTDEETETEESTAYEACIEPVGCLTFEEVPETYAVYNGAWADMAFALGQRDGFLTAGRVAN